MAKSGGSKAAVKPSVITRMPITNANEASEKEHYQVFEVKDVTTEEDILRADASPGMRLHFDYVYFKKLSDEFVARLSGTAQKAYWLAFAEYDKRVREANIGLHSVSVDPMAKMLDGPKGKANPLVRDIEILQKLLPDYYVTSRVEGGEGDVEAAKGAGFKVIRRPADEGEEKSKSPLDWNGEVWKIRDGTVDMRSGEAIYNVLVCIRKGAWEDHLKAMSMVSHNKYSQNKQEFVEGAKNISKDLIREEVTVQDLDDIRAEEHTFGGRK